MSLGSDELSRLTESYGDRRIGGSLYCGNCGYNLKTLPYVYKCPECGNAFNARPLSMKGIFLPVDTSMPWSSALGALCFVTLTVVMLVRGLNPIDGFRIFAAVLCALVAVYHIWSGKRRLRRFLKYRFIARQIEAENPD